MYMTERIENYVQCRLWNTEVLDGRNNEFFLHESTKNVDLISQREIEQQALSILYMFIVHLPARVTITTISRV